MGPGPVPLGSAQLTLSPNHGPRRDGARPSLIVLHYTVLGRDQTLDRLCDPAAEVSAHYVICPHGGMTCLVPETERAWHAGAGAWGAIGDVNSHSIGIEIVNDGASPFSHPQMGALACLMAGIRGRWAIPDQGIIGHSDLAPGRKSDPGARFDWRGLALQGHGVWPHSAIGAGARDHSAPTPDWTCFVRDAARFGYTADVAPQVVLDAMRLRFRPWASGPLDAVDMAIIADLAARFPVDALPPKA